MAWPSKTESQLTPKTKRPSSSKWGPFAIADDEASACDCDLLASTSATGYEPGWTKARMDPELEGLKIWVIKKHGHASLKR